MKKTFSRMSRREALGLGASTLLASLGIERLARIGRASAGNPYVTGYKALVCVYLNGGNNGFNTFVPTSPTAYAQYTASRGNLALGQSSLLPLNGTASDGNSYGMHPSCPELQALFNAGNMAVVCNVGTLIQPTTPAQAQAGSVPLPPQLFSHIDQTTEWMTSIPQSQARFGWAGRIADLLAKNGVTANLAYNINVGGSNAWQEGVTTNPYFLGVDNVPILKETMEGHAMGARMTAVNALLSQAAMDSNPMVSQYQAVLANAGAKQSVVTNATTTAGDLTTQFPNAPNDGAAGNDTELDGQLHEVARVIKAYQQIGDARQIFYLQINGFDTHNAELATQATLLKYVSQYINNFWSAMAEINMQNNVMLFTMSDFGRTLGSNGDGSDHAWGNHQIVLGGGVKGGYYGTMPTLTVGGPDDFGSGRLIPTTSTDQLAATIATWFGVAAADIPGLFPNLKNFTQQTLPFLA
jgi:uncharacterized protein (DUF1501 family)